MIVHQAFMEGKFAVKQTPQCFDGVGADMALEQIINRSQKSLSRIIGSTRKKHFVARLYFCVSGVFSPVCFELSVPVQVIACKDSSPK